MCHGMERLLFGSPIHDNTFMCVAPLWGCDNKHFLHEQKSKDIHTKKINHGIGYVLAIGFSLIRMSCTPPS